MTMRNIQAMREALIELCESYDTFGGRPFQRPPGNPWAVIRSWLAAPVEQPVAWLPIESAPSEDDDVLCFCDESFPLMVGSWSGRVWQDANGAMEERDAPPTHWMPLPKPPAIAAIAA